MKFKYPFVVVIWDDAESDASWRQLDDLHLKPTLALTAGFILKEDEQYLILGDSYFLEKSDKTISNTTKIPKGMIKEVKQITLHEKREKKTNKPIEKVES